MRVRVRVRGRLDACVLSWVLSGRRLPHVREPINGRQLARDHGMCTTCVATFPRSRGRPMLVPVHVAGELWPNALNRAVGVLGSSGMGWGAMVLPFLSRRREGAAVHATSVECYNTTTVQYDTWPVDEVRGG